jgi:hypothetical protein
MVLGCPPRPLSCGLAAALAAQLGGEGKDVRLVELGPAWPGPLPFPREHVPVAGRAKASTALAPSHLREILRRLVRAEGLVVHLPGRDGPLVRALALASRRALLVPPPEGLPDADSADLLRACLDASHRLRVAWVSGDRPSPAASARVVRLTPPPGLGPDGLPASWIRWLAPEEGEADPLLAPPLAALRLLPAAAE